MRGRGLIAASQRPLRGSDLARRGRRLPVGRVRALVAEDTGEQCHAGHSGPSTLQAAAHRQPEEAADQDWGEVEQQISDTGDGFVDRSLTTAPGSYSTGRRSQNSHSPAPREPMKSVIDRRNLRAAGSSKQMGVDSDEKTIGGHREAGVERRGGMV
jgi:hypothetical protein